MSESRSLKKRNLRNKKYVSLRFDMKLKVIGAGLAGCEAAWQAARFGCRVRLVEMKPARRSPAHSSDGFAELVCSNSLRDRKSVV